MAQRDIIVERRKKIVTYINEKGRADIAELALLTQSTEVTVRRDLAYLEKSESLIRIHGGAVKNERKKSIWRTSSIGSRLEKNKEQKERIAQFAVTLINDNDSLMIDGGSTTQIFASFLKDKHNLLVVTNSPGIAEILLDNDTNRVIQIGGELVRDTHQVAGPDAEAHIRRYNVDKCIISVTGADPEAGLSAAIPIEASIKRTMIEQARQSILLIDSSKFERKALCYAFDFKAFDTVVTDSNISKQTVERLRKQDVKLYIV
ncbi:MAG TPA: DeoR/GlpR family DNA-binding transcription regulator [Sphaerochaeta sp.]|nr:DeoR/GlpR family DNA-binding transcription regulator [Sphaerochaeta sp.]